MMLHISAEAWTAIFTGGLFVVAVVGSWFGIKQLRAATEQARIANQLYKLEVAPIIAIGQTKGGNSGPDMRFVVTRDAQKTVFRPYDFDSDAVRGTGRVAHYGGAPDFRRLTLEIHNAGRSPAVRLRIDFVIYVTDSTEGDVAWWRQKPQSHDGVWEEGRDYPFVVAHAGTGHGTLMLPVLGVDKSFTVLVENRLGAPVMLNASVASVSSIANDSAQSRIDVELAKPAEDVFRISASQRTTPGT